MLRLFFLFLGMIAVAMGAAWMADNPGLLTIEWRGWLVELSLGIALVGLVVLLFVLTLLLRWLGWIARGPKTLRQRGTARRRDRGVEAAGRGLVAIAAGDMAQAKYFANKADNLLEQQPLNLLLGAQTAQLDGRDDEARALFEQMRQRRDTEFLGLRGLLAYARRDGDQGRALELARRAYQLKPKVPWVAQELILLEVDDGGWDNALRIAKQAGNRKVLTAADADRHQGALMLGRAAQKAGQGDYAGAASLAEKAVRFAPLPAALQAIAHYRAAGKSSKADRLLRQVWPGHDHPELTDLAFGEAAAETPEARLSRLKSFVGPHAEVPQSRRLLARAALAAGDYPLARETLQPLLEGRPDKETCQLMAELSELQGRDMDGARHWLKQATLAPVPPVWRCQECHEPNENWQPHCPTCGAFASIGWDDKDHGPAPQLQSTPVEDEVAATDDGENPDRAIESEAPPARIPAT